MTSQNDDKPQIQIYVDKIKELDDTYVKAISESITNLCIAICNAQANGLSVEIYGFNGKVTKEPFPNYNPVKLFVHRNIDLIKWQA